MTLLTPKEAAAALGTTVQTISSMIKLGAPVHRWGPSGYRYKIDPDEWIRWQDEYHEKKHPRPGDRKHGPGAPDQTELPQLSTAQMARRRHDLLAAMR